MMEAAMQDTKGGLLSCVVDILPLESHRTKPVALVALYGGVCVCVYK